MLSRLIYTSTRKSVCTDQEINNILVTANKKNGPQEITGVLLYTTNKFMQCLEGDYKTIINLYDIIKKDNRHKNVTLIQLSSVRERLFPLWVMGHKKITLDDIEFNSQMNDHEKSEFISVFKGEKDQSNQIINFIGKVI